MQKHFDSGKRRMSRFAVVCRVLVFVALLQSMQIAQAVTNNLALSPPMGWNDWNSFFCNITETDIVSFADQIATNGMKAAGYQYVNVDDCWQASRDANGIIVADPAKFPHGMAWLADYVHSKGLKFGLYSSHGTETCQGKPGSYGYEYLDAMTYASWGVDYLKYDSCNVPVGALAEDDYSRMSDGLLKCGRPIVFSICGGDKQSSPGYESWSPVLGNLWRTTIDIQPTYADLITHLDPNSATAFASGPGHWNDPDIMEVGRLAMTGSANQVEFTMWCIMAAPLIMGNNFVNMTAQAKAILTNPEAIAVDQDPTGEQGVKVVNNVSPIGTNEVWSKTLGYDFSTKAVALLNRIGPSTNITCYWTNLGLQAGPATVRDLWSHTDLGTFTNSFTTNVAATNVVMLKIVGVAPAPPVAGTNYLNDLQAVYAYTGSGTIVKDKSIGGNPIRLGGVTHSRGIGVSAFSGVEYDLGGVCSRFQATVGVDNEEIGIAAASVEFHVYADGVDIYDSGVMFTNTPPQTVDLDVTGVSRLVLGVGDADDNTNNDHADWADALVVVTNTTPMTPYSPGGLSATGGNQITLAWNPSLSATNYNVERALSSGGPYAKIASLPTTVYADSNVVSGTTYYYAVSAVNRFGESYDSTNVAAVACDQPDVPANVAASMTSSNIIVAWSAVSGASSYSVSRFTGNTPPAEIASGIVDTSYADITAPSATNYYLVKSVNACGQSEFSAFVPATVPPGIPTGLTATPGDTQVALQWNTVSGATSYKVKRATANGGPYTTIDGSVAGTNYLDTAVTNGITYYYVVSSVGPSGESFNSGSVSATPNIPLGSPPSISSQPASQTNYATLSVTFAVAASSGPPMYFQWQAGALNSGGPYTNLTVTDQIPAVTNPALSISNLIIGNAGDYLVIVTNSNGSVTSSVAHLSVVDAVPSITTQPASQTNFAGQTATLTVAAAGLPPLYYQWRAGASGSGSYSNLVAGSQISAVTNATLNIAGVTLGNAGDYVVVVTNSSGSVTSAVVRLTLLTNISYQAVVLGDHPVSYWPLNETNGTVIHDIVGTNNGTCVNPGGLTLGGPGILSGQGLITDKAIYFTNTSSAYIKVPYSATLNTPQFTVEVWLNMPVFPATGAGVDMNPLTFDDSNPKGWAFEIPSPNSPNPSMYGWLGVNNTWTQVSSGTCIQGTWSYYALTYDGATFTIYTNGVAAGSENSGHTLVSSLHSVYMGAYDSGGTVVRYYRGGMENVAMYSNALSANQILNHYRVGSTFVPVLTPPTMSIQRSGTNVIVSWSAGFLQQANFATGSWMYVTGAASPYTIGVTNSAQFFRGTLQGP